MALTLLNYWQRNPWGGGLIAVIKINVNSGLCQNYALSIEVLIPVELDTFHSGSARQARSILLRPYLTCRWSLPLKIYALNLINVIHTFCNFISPIWLDAFRLKHRLLSWCRRHRTPWSQKITAPQTYCFYCFPRSFVLLLPIALNELCLLHKVRAQSYANISNKDR